MSTPSPSSPTFTHGGGTVAVDWRQRIAERPTRILVVVLVLLCIVTRTQSAGFFSVNQLTTTLIVTCPLAMLAGGQTLCLLIGGIDMSVVMSATAAGYLSAKLAPHGALVSLLVGFAAALAIGLVNGLGIAVFKVNALIMTLGMQGIVLGLLTVGAQNWLRGSTQVTPFARSVGQGTFFGGHVPWNLLVWAVLGGGLLFGLRSSGLGRMIYAVGDNPRAARLGGVRVWQIQMAVYLLCALLGAVAGVMFAGRNGSADLGLASGFLLPSVAAAVIGGTSILGGWGGYTGTILGALILSVLDTLLVNIDAKQGVRLIIYGMIIGALAWLFTYLTGDQ